MTSVLGAIVWAFAWLIGLLALLTKTAFGRLVGYVLFAAPVVWLVVTSTQQRLEERKFWSDVEWMKGLCAQDGGVKVYQRVVGVEGVFQLRGRSPNAAGEASAQFGMFDPYGRSLGDSAYPELWIYRSAEHKGYRFLEQQPGFGKAGPPFLRTVVTERPATAGKYDAAKFGRRTVTVQTRRSQYGYLVEDLSTRELREHWIAKGRVKIMNLQTGQVLAEAVGYYKSSTLGVPDYRRLWTGSGISCGYKGSIVELVASVAVPVADEPSTKELQELGEAK